LLYYLLRLRPRLETRDVGILQRLETTVKLALIPLLRLLDEVRKRLPLIVSDWSLVIHGVDLNVASYPLQSQFQDGTDLG
jgi:hypothetical protein